MTAPTFDSRDATLNTLLSEDLLTARPVVSESLSRLSSGARCNSSAHGGKVFFVVNILKHDELTDDTELHPEALIGVSSRNIAAAQLGSGSSWAYSSSGQKWTASKPEAFGIKFSAGDSIGCFLDLESETCTMSFSHNGTWLGQAHHLPKPDQRLGGLYPHVLLKGVSAEVDFTESGRSDWPAEASDYTSWMAALNEGNVSVSHQSEALTEADHEVLVLVGLPGSGKSTWATRYVANHPEKHYALLGVDSIIKQLKGSSLTRGKQKPPDAKTQQLAEQAYEELLDHIETVPRNYVLDDSNVYEGIRTARVSKFRKAGFKTRAAVIVLPDSSLFRRQRKQHQEEGKSVPETVIADMRANFSMPEVGEVFQEVFFVEAKPPEANEIAAAQADAAKAALPMLKARGSGGRQTRSRTAKAAPKRASAPAKVSEATKTAADVSSPKQASAPAKAAEGNKKQPDAVEPSAKGAAADKAATSTKSHKSSDSAAKPDSAAMPVPADSTMTAAEPAAASEEAMSTDKPVASPMTAASDKQESTEAGEDEEVPATNTENGPAGVTQEQAAPSAADNEADKAAALSAAFAEAEVAGEEAEEAFFVEARKSGQSAMAASAEAETAREEAAEEALEEAKQAKGLKEEGRPAAVKDAAVVEHKHDQDVKPAAPAKAPAQTQVDAEQPKQETVEEQAQAEQPKQEQQVEPMAEDKPKTEQRAPEDQAAKTSEKTKAEKAAQPAEAGQSEAAKEEEDGQQATPMDTATADAGGGEKKENGAVAGAGGGGDGRGVKRPPAPAVVRAAKQARTNQAAGRLVGNIRSQGTVKRTVIRGRVGTRPAGMRLPPPMSSPPEVAPASKAAAAAAAQDSGAATGKAGDGQDKDTTQAVKDEDKARNLKDVMQQLLPAEQAASKAAPKEPSSTPHGAPKGSPQGDKQQAQRASSTAKASTPKLQDQVTTKPAGAKSGDTDKDKERQERDRSHSARREPARSHPAPRHGGRTLPPPISSRQGTAAAPGPNRHQSRDRPAPRIAALGPRDAGIQKFRGRPPSTYNRAPRHAPGRVMPPGGPARHGPPMEQRPGREFAAGPHRAGPNWDRKAPVRTGAAPARLPPPMGRRAPAPERESLPGRAPRDNFGGKQRVPNPRVPMRGAGPDRSGPDRAAPGAGFPVGRRAGPPGARQPGPGPPHTAPRAAPPRGRVPPPAARRDSHPPLVAQGSYDPPVAPFPADRQPARYTDQPRYSDAAPDQRVPRAARGNNRPTPVGPRAAGGRGPPPQVFSPPGRSRQQAQHAQQQPANYRSPAAPVTLPAPRMGPLPGGPVPGLGGGEYTPRGRRDPPGSHADRPRSRSRGAPAVQRGPPYSDRPAPRGGRQPAAQQLRSAVYPQEQPMSAPYCTSDGPPTQAHPPPQYEPPMASYAPEPHSARRGGFDRAPDRYAPGPPQQWQNKPDPAPPAAPSSDYQQRAQGPPGRDSFGRQGYGDQPGSDSGADRRTDRRGRGSKDRRQQRVADRPPPPLDAPRYPGRGPQGYMEQEYAPGLAPDGYLPRDAPPLNRSHAYPEEPRGGDPSYLPPQQHAQSAPPRYDSPMPGYAPPLGPDSHQPVYGSGAAAPMQGYASTAPPVERQPYYPPQQQGHQQGGPLQQQPYADAPAYGREPAYSSAQGGYPGPQGGYVDNPPAMAPRGGYSQSAPVSVPRHRSDDYDPAYSGSGRSQGYTSQGRPLSNAPGGHGGVSHDAGGARGAPRGGTQAWAPSPRETSYGGTPHGSGAFPQSNSRQQGGYQNSPAGNWSGSSRHAPQDMYPPHQPTGSGQMHGAPGGYRR